MRIAGLIGALVCVAALEASDTQPNSNTAAKPEPDKVAETIVTEYFRRGSVPAEALAEPTRTYWDSAIANAAWRSELKRFGRVQSILLKEVRPTSGGKILTTVQCGQWQFAVVTTYDYVDQYAGIEWDLTIVDTAPRLGRTESIDEDLYNKAKALVLGSPGAPNEDLKASANSEWLKDPPPAEEEWSLPEPPYGAIQRTIRDGCLDSRLDVDEQWSETVANLETVDVVVLMERGAAQVSLTGDGSGRFRSMYVRNLDGLSGAVADRARAKEIEDVRKYLDLSMAALEASVDQLSVVEANDAKYYFAADAERVLADARRITTSAFAKEPQEARAVAEAYAARDFRLPPVERIALPREERVVYVVPQSHVDDAIRSIHTFWERYIASGDLTPDLRVQSTPDGARVTLNIPGNALVRRKALTDDVLPNVWIGIYQARIERAGFQPVDYEVDLVNDVRPVIRCELAKTGSKTPSICRRQEIDK